MRINKYLSSCGVCSRRGADELILGGRITINGQMAQIGNTVDPDADIVMADGIRITPRRETVVIAFNKPEGVVCSLKAQDKNEKCLNDVIDIGERIYPVGRLDKDSRGLVLLTNDGDLADRIMRAGDTHEKEYVVKLKEKCDDAFLEEMSRGVTITLQKDGKTYDYMTRPCRVFAKDSHSFGIILTEGKNRQIRKMCSALKKNVVSLTRTRIVGVKLGNLKVGEYRKLSEEEIRQELYMLPPSSLRL